VEAKDKASVIRNFGMRLTPVTSFKMW